MPSASAVRCPAFTRSRRCWARPTAKRRARARPRLWIGLACRAGAAGRARLVAAAAATRRRRPQRRCWPRLRRARACAAAPVPVPRLRPWPRRRSWPRCRRRRCPHRRARAAPAQTPDDKAARLPPGAAPKAPGPSPAAASAAEPRIYQLSELPDEIRRELPTLAVGGAMYSQNPANRMLIVNGQTFHEGDKLGPNLSLAADQAQVGGARVQGLPLRHHVLSCARLAAW